MSKIYIFENFLENRMNFIRKITEGKSDEWAKRQLTRYGKGNYEQKAVLQISKGKNNKGRRRKSKIIKLYLMAKIKEVKVGDVFRTINAGD